MKYYHVKKSDVAATLNYISWSQSTAGTFYNVSVLPYRGKKYNPDTFVTIRVG